MRVFLGTDPETHARRYATRTVRGSKRAAHMALVELVADASHAPRAGARSSVAGLLVEWVAAASPNWASTRSARSTAWSRIISFPHLGAVVVGELTTARVDAFYATLRRYGGSMVYCTPRSRKRNAGTGSGSTLPPTPAHRDTSPTKSTPRAQLMSRC